MRSNLPIDVIGSQLTANEKSPELITLALSTLGSFDFSGNISIHLSFLMLIETTQVMF